MGRRMVMFGGTGQVGAAALRALSAADQADLAVVTRRPAALVEAEMRGIEVFQYDLDRPEQEGLGVLVDILSGANTILLATGYSGRMLPQSKAVIDAATAAGVNHIVHLGAHATPDTTIVHLGWHQMIEAYVAAAGPAWTFIRPTAFMQNLLLLRALAGAPERVLVHYSGDASSSWIDAEDVGRAVAAVLKSPVDHRNEVIRLGTETATMAEIAGIISELTGEPWTPEARDPSAFLQAAKTAGADDVYMACVGTIFRRSAAGQLQDLNETFDDYQRLTGRRPTSLRTFLERHREAFSV